MNILAPDLFAPAAPAPGATPPPAVFTFPLEPVAKPRMTQRDRWKKRPCVVRYREYADRLRELAAEQGFAPPEAGLALAFVLPMPASWKERKRREMDGQPHRQRPDLDNLVKAFFDALLGEDSVVWHLGEVRKLWGAEGGIVAAPMPQAQVAALAMAPWQRLAELHARGS